MRETQNVGQATEERRSRSSPTVYRISRCEGSPASGGVRLYLAGATVDGKDLQAEIAREASRGRGWEPSIWLRYDHGQLDRVLAFGATLAAEAAAAGNVHENDRARRTAEHEDGRDITCPHACAHANAFDQRRAQIAGVLEALKARLAGLRRTR